MLTRFLLSATVVLSLGFQAWSQEEPFNAVFKSAYSAEKDAVGALIELQTKDGQLGLSRRWGLQIDRENANDDQTDESRLEAAIQRHIDLGRPEEFARMMAERELGRAGAGMFGGQNPAVCMFMSRLHQNLGGGGSGSSSSGAKLTRRFRGDRYSMSMGIDGQQIKMKLFDDGENGFEVQVVESPESEIFLFRFNSLDMVVNYVQRDGEAKLSYIVGDEADVLKGSSYEEILANHPGPMNNYLLALWDELGIVEPISLSNPEAMKAAVAVLDSIQNDEDEVLELMEALDSDSLSAREGAAAELSKSFFKWKYWIEKSKSKFEYDKISKDHLKKVVKGSPGTPAQDYANSLDLTGPKTLLRILELANEEQRPIVVGQLQSVTGEEFREVSAWREFISGDE